MLVAHKMIDALLGRGSSRLWPIAGVDEAQRQKVAALIETAQKFDFGDLLLEPVASKKEEFGLPTLTPEECEYWNQGLIPLPFQTCWYEFVVQDVRDCLLIMRKEEEKSVHIYHLEHTPGAQKGEILFDGILLEVVAAEAGGWWRYSVSENLEAVAALRARGQFDSNVGSLAPLMVYLTLMLNSHTTEIELVQPPKFLNRKRAKKGLACLPAHRVVHIVPHHYRQEAERKAKAEHRSPRLHWRRSHWRHFDHQTGNSKYMPSLVYNGREGWWVTVVPRMLVGKAELGEVSHEYRLASTAVH